MPTSSRSTATGPLLALLAASALLLGACGSSGSDGSAATSTTAAGATTTEAGDTSTTESDGSSTTDGTDGTDTTDPVSSSTTASGSAPTGDEDAYVAAVEEAIAESLAPIEADQASCIAEDWVATLGFDRLDGTADPGGLGRGDESVWKLLEVDDDEADVLYAIVADCGYDFPGAIRASITTGETPENAACLNKQLTDEVVANFMKNSFRGDSSQSELSQVGATCE